MMANIIQYTCLAVIFLTIAIADTNAGDLDDDMTIDEKITKYDKLDRPGINIQYIKRRAKASIADDSGTSKGGGDVAIGGFINKPGAEVGDVTIIFNGEDINAISE
jgi:hypothetical protein